MCQIQRLVSNVDNGTDTNASMFGHRGSESSQNNIKGLSIIRYRSSGNCFSSASNRATNALQRKKGFQSTSNSKTIF